MLLRFNRACNFFGVQHAVPRVAFSCPLIRGN
jgi:hypothetical protein